jgi:microcystin degradation protein MlrC
MAKRKLRIGFARINQETNALSPMTTQFEDFEKTHYLQGPELLQACSKGGYEARGFVKRAELAGFVDSVVADGDTEAVPLFSAWTVPGAPLSRECFDTLQNRLQDQLRRAGELDGFYLCLHGAMGVRGVVDPDTELTKIVREHMGDKPVTVSHDLHANVTQARMDLSTALLAYRTNPHRDHAKIGKRCGQIAIRAARNEIAPVSAWRSLPIILGGGNTLDFAPPLLSIFWRMSQMERDRRVLSASLFTVHPWNNHPDLGWSVNVCADGDRSLAERLADELAERAWAVRHQQPPYFSTASEAIQSAREAKLARRLGVVVFADASDVVTAGATGENTELLRALLEEGADLVSYVPVRDPQVVRELWTTDVGKEVEVTLGGKLAPEWGRPLTVRAKLERLQNMMGLERVAVLRAGKCSIVVTEGPPFAIKPSFYQDLGLPILEADVVIAKNFFPFRMFFLPFARKTIYVRTRGLTDFDASFTLKFNDPVHPRDTVDDWHQTDQRRRGLL